jgi:predicted phage terminase large subunit-like protein
VSAPTHPELWEKYEEMLRNVEDADREITADNFYFENQEAMDEGCETLWERRFSYRDLMKIKVNVGSRAFGSEYLNRPTDDETAIFKSSYFQFYEEKDLYYSDGRAMNMDIFGFFDIAIGKNDRSDYNAIVTVGRDKRTGVLYVLDAWAEKIPMHKALEVAEKKILQYRHKVFGVESVQAQYDTFRQLRDNLTKRNHYSTRLEPIIPKNRKEERIEELEPLVEAGTIRFKRSQRLLLEQLEQFPTGDHDDTCDALASAVQLAGKQRKRSYYSKPSGF